ncbi:MAG: histone-like protein [Halobacteriales archaeon]
MAELTVKKAVKETVAAEDKNVSSDVYDALDAKVEEILQEAAGRADENGRKTVMAYDL